MRIVACLLFAAALIAPTASAATLKIATLAPDGTAWMKVMRAAAKDVKAETEGRVKIKFFPGGVQGSDKSVLRKMRIGQLQGGAVATGSLIDLSPATQLYNLPFTFRTLEEVRAIREEFDPYIREEMGKKGYELLGISEAGFAYMMSGEAIRTSDDARKQKVWVPEGDLIGATTFEKGGVEPISLPLSDVYTSLQTGLIDTIVVNASSAIALQWHTKVKYVTDFPLLFLTGAIIVDKKAFKRLSADDQETVRRIMGDAFAKMDAQNELDEAGARDALAQNGIEFVELSDADKQAWEALATGVVAELADKNVYPVDVFKRLQERLNELRQNP